MSTYDVPTLPDFYAGKPLDAQDPQAIVDDLRNVHQSGVDNFFNDLPGLFARGNRIPPFLEYWPAKIITPSVGEDALPKAVYRVQRLAFPAGGADLDTTKWTTDKRFPNDGVNAVNLDELKAADTSGMFSLLPPGTIVTVFARYAQESSRRKVYWFSCPPPAPLPVNLTSSGSAGDATSQCSFVYTAKDLNGNTIATGLSWSPRPDVGECKAGTVGTVVWYANAWVLWSCNEVANAVACS